MWAKKEANVISYILMTIEWHPWRLDNLDNMENGTCQGKARECEKLTETLKYFRNDRNFVISHSILLLNVEIHPKPNV